MAIQNGAFPVSVQLGGGARIVLRPWRCVPQVKAALASVPPSEAQATIAGCLYELCATGVFKAITGHAGAPTAADIEALSAEQKAIIAAELIKEA